MGENTVFTPVSVGNLRLWISQIPDNFREISRMSRYLDKGGRRLKWWAVRMVRATTLYNESLCVDLNAGSECVPVESLDSQFGNT